MRTVAHQLFRAVVPGIVVALLSGGLVLDHLISARLERDFDEVLTAKARSLIALTELENDVLEVEEHDHSLPAYSDREAPDYFLMRHPDGRVLVRSPSVEDPSWLVAPEAPATTSYRDVRLPDGRSGRVRSERFAPLIDDDEGTIISTPIQVTLMLASSRESLDALLTSVHLVLATTGLGIAAVIVLLARHGIRRTLAPLEEIGRQVGGLDPTQPGQRLALDSSSAELDRLTRRFNALLERVEGAIVRERQFSADVAHELRTPLAELTTLVEVNERWPDNPTLRAAFHDDLTGALSRMERTVTNLLALSRSESGVDGVGTEADLVDLIDEAVNAASRRSAEREVSFRTTRPEGAFVVEGLEQWQGILTNLLDNAGEYARAGSVIEVTLKREMGRDGPAGCLSVVNEVDALNPTDVDHFFERLWRKEAARSSTVHGGLGLSLVRAYASQLDVTATAELEADGERVHLRIGGIVEQGTPAPFPGPLVSGRRNGTSESRGGTIADALPAD